MSLSATVPLGSMQKTRMVRLATVNSTFHARVIAARLGADGITTQLQGNLDGPYPMGQVHVYVAEDDLEAARELLLADEVESAFDTDEVDDGGGRPAYELWIIVAAIVLVAALILARSL